MSITFPCAKCHKQIRAREELARKPVLCPHCKATNRVPPVEMVTSEFRTAAAHDESTYELAERPTSPWAYESASILHRPHEPEPAEPEPPHKHGRKDRSKPTRTRDRDGGPVKADRRKPPLLMLFGVRVTVLRLVVLAAIVAAPFVWYALTVGQATKVAVARPVSIQPLLTDLTLREPYNLLTAGGDHAVGVKVPGALDGSTENDPAPVYSLGGSDRLVTVAPTATGNADHVLVEAHIQVKAFRDRQRISGETFTLRARDFELVDDLGHTLPAAGLLTDRFDRAVPIDLALGGGGYENLLPAGVKPSQVQLAERTSAGVPAGAITFNPPSGAEGRLSFTDRRAASDGQPGARGFDAYGRITVDRPAGETLFDYQGDRLLITTPDSGNTWWLTDSEEHAAGVSPFERVRATLLFEVPDDPADRYELRYVNHKLASVEPFTSAAGATATLATRAPLKAAAEPSSSPASNANRQPSGGLGGYFDAMTTARQRARGLVAESGMRQLALALQLHQQNHDAPPQSMDDLAPYLGVHPSALPNPRTGDQPGYIFVPPPRDADPDQTVVVYEAKNGRPDFAGGKLYLSGRIEPGVHGSGR